MNPGSPIVAETARLRVRRFNLDDADFIFELVNDPAWLRFIGDRGVRSIEDALGYISRGPLASYETLGFGLYLVELKDTRAPVGMCGLLKRDHLEDPDIGFAFLPQYTGKGYARETAAAVLAHGRQLGMRRILAIVNPENESSTRLLLKLGFRLEGTILPPGEDREINLFVSDVQGPASNQKGGDT